VHGGSGDPGRLNGKDGPARQRAALDGSKGASGLGFRCTPSAHGGGAPASWARHPRPGRTTGGAPPQQGQNAVPLQF
jgi:hypothetical protein